VSTKPAYPALSTTRKTGEEEFLSKGETADFNLLSFWRWSASDLVSNATRGILAEFLVAQALGLATGVRAEWDSYDLQLEDGRTIEVKSAAYLQTWKQKALSLISFGIAPTTAWNPTTSEFGSEKKRQADLYVFCLLETKEQDKLNPMDLDQWVFYALPTTALDAACPTQGSIGFNALLKLDPVICRYAELADVVRAFKG
jgi:hypothetical protein